MLVFNFAIMPGLFVLELIKSIFTMSIWLSLSVFIYSLFYTMECFVSHASAYHSEVIHLATFHASVPICWTSLRWMAGSTVSTHACLSFLLFWLHGVNLLIPFCLTAGCCLCPLGLFSPCPHHDLITCNFLVFS